MELKKGPRGRAATCSRSKMASRKKDKADDKERPEWVDNPERRLMEAMESQRELLLKRIDDLEGKMDVKIEGIKTELPSTMERVKVVEQKSQSIEKGWHDKMEQWQDQLFLRDCKLLDNFLCFRGIPEMKGEVRQEIINVLAEFLEKTPEETDGLCDEIYRVNSDFARDKKLPRDVIIKVLTNKMRNLILTKNTEEPMEVMGKRIKIWKELPKEVFQQRKKFKQLTEKLIQRKIRFRWEILRGVSFMFEGQRWIIKTEEQMQEFLTTKVKKLENQEKGEGKGKNQNGS